MVGHQELRILRYNVQKSRDVVLASLFQDPRVLEYDILDGELTIDLTFASEDVASRIIRCKIDKSLDSDSDHLPIALAIDWSWQAAIPTRCGMVEEKWPGTDRIEVPISYAMSIINTSKVSLFVSVNTNKMRCC